MSPAAPRAAFNLCAGDPALDLVNSLDNRFRAGGPTELLPDYGALVRFLVQSRLLGARQGALLARAASPGAAARALRSVRELREAAAATLYASLDHRAPSPADIAVLERHFLAASHHRELCWEPATRGTHGRRGVTWSRGRFARHAELPVWVLSEAVCALLTGSGLERLRACGVETCRWLFLDTSKNHTRRWCDMKLCGNRMKARRFQARQARAA